MLKQCEEMEKGVGEDDTHDYWEERKSIAKWIKDLEKAQDILKEVEEELKVKEPRLKEIQSEYKKAHGDIEKCQDLIDEVEGMNSGALIDKAMDAKDIVGTTKDEMNDCQIPVNIKMRGNELKQILERL